MRRRYRKQEESGVGLVILAGFALGAYFIGTDFNRWRQISLYAWIAVILLILVMAIIAVYSWKQRQKKLQALHIIDLPSLSGIEFENYLYFLLPKIGFSSVEHVGRNGDFGADLLATKDGKKYAIQAKRYSNAVGVDAIYQCLGGQKYYACDESIIITNSYFTPPALELGKRDGITLINRDALAEWIAEVQTSTKV